ncbi:hypothetical protein WK34_20580 [Burkholderia vietnamiensis]|nr:hypothetical protein WK34_20580 [Burkholderia vietnamiensis]
MAFSGAVLAAWEEWLIIALGLWLPVSPEWFGFASSAALMGNLMAICVLLVPFAAWALAAERKTEHPIYAGSVGFESGNANFSCATTSRR